MIHLKNLYFNNWVKVFLLTLLVFVFTFPLIDPVLDPGPAPHQWVDPPLLWAYNYFYQANIPSGTSILFTHGPLAYILNPQSFENNLYSGLLLISLVHFSFIFSFLYLSRQTKNRWWFIWAIPAGLFAIILTPEYEIIGISACALMIHMKNEKHFWLGLAMLAGVFGLYVKSYIGIIALLNVIAYLLVVMLVHKRYRFILFSFAGLLAIFSLTWLLIYHHLDGLGRFLYATIEFSKNNSSAAAIYPENNWLLLSGSIVLFLLLPFAIREKKTWMFFGIFLLPVFAAWKHGITREDIYHVEGFLFYLAMVLSLLILVSDKLNRYHLAMIVGLLLLFHMNMKNCILYREYEISTQGFSNFNKAFFNFSKLSAESKLLSEKNLEPFKLSEATCKMIGNKTVDAYPWNFYYIPANKFNWSPRPVLQSYAAYTSWLDEQNAAFFMSVKAPDFLLWEIINDKTGDELSGIDDRYLLNDEPRTLLKILNHYQFVKTDGRVMVLSKRKAPCVGESKSILKQQVTWNTWHEVPRLKDGFLRVEMNSKGTIMRFLKTQFYKDEAFFIEYRFDNGEEKKYRIVPSTSGDGLWVNPFIRHLSADFTEPLVTAIRFSCSNEGLMKKEIDLDWKLTEINAEKDSVAYSAAFGIFGKKSSSRQEVFFASTLDFETTYPVYWTGDTTAIDSKHFYRGKRSYLLKQEYSPGFNLPLDSLNNFSVQASVFVSGAVKELKDIKLVISIQDKGKDIYWDAVSFTDFTNEKEQWQEVVLKRKFTDQYPKGSVLKVYVWNSSGGETSLDELQVKIIRN